MAYQAGTAFLQVLPSLKGLHTRIRAELSGIKASVPVALDTGNIRSEIAAVRATVGSEQVTVKAKADTAEARADVSGLGGMLRGLTDKEHRVKVDVDKRPLVDSANAVVTLGRNLTNLAGAVIGGAALPAITSLTGAAVQTAGALFLLPAAGAAAAATGVTVSVATRGMADAFKLALDPSANPEKLAAAMGAISPNARALVSEVRTIKPAFDSMGIQVQDAAFVGLGARVRELSGTYLPVLRTGMTGVATEINGATQRVVAFVMQSQTVRDVQSVFTNTGLTVRNLSPALVDVLTILRDIVAVGITYLPGLALGFSGATARAREFVSAARESGQLAQWIQGGIDNLRLLGQIATNTGAILIGVYRASNSDARGFLQTLVDITARWREWINSAAGANTIRDFFVSLRDISSALAPILGVVVGALLSLVTRIGPMMPAVSSAFVALANSAAPVLDIFWELASIVLPPLLRLIEFLAPALGPFIGLAISGAIAVKAFSIALAAGNLILAGARIAWAALNLVMSLNPFGLVVVAIGLLVAGLIYAWNNCETFRNVVITAWEAVKSAAAGLWSWLQGVFTSIGNGARDLGTWLSGVFSEIGRVVSGVGQFFMDLYTNWVRPAFDGILNVAKIAVGILIAVVLTPIQIYLNLVGLAFEAWRTVAVFVFNAINSAAQAFWSFVSGIFNAVTSYLASVFGPAWNSSRDTVIGAWDAMWGRIDRWWNAEVQPLIDGVMRYLTLFGQANMLLKDIVVSAWNMMWDRLAAWWNNEVRPLWDLVVNFVTVTLPNAYTTLRDILIARWNEMWARLATWWNSEVRPLWDSLIAYIMGPFTAGWNFLRNTTIAVWNAMRDGINAAWVFIRDNIWNPLVTFITVTIPNGFRAGVATVGALWNGIKAALRTPLQAAIDIVWNNGIVKVWDLVRGIIPGLPDIPGRGFQLPGLAKGGPVDKPTVAMIGEAGPEYVFSSPAVRNMGGMGAMDDLHKRAMSPRKKVQQMNRGYTVEGADHNGPGSSTVGFGGVRPHVAQAGHFLKRKFGIGTVGGVGARANLSDHPSGHALDFMTSGASGDNLSAFLSSPANWQHFAIKYQIWKQRIMNRPGAWTPMANRGSVTANHFDHVHVSFLTAGGSGAMDGGGGGPSIMDLLGQAWSTVTGAVSKLASLGNSPWAQAVSGFGRKIVDTTWGWLSEKASAFAATLFTGDTGATTGAPAVGGVQRWAPVALQALARTGQPASLLNVLLRRMQQESGGNPSIVNTTDINARRGTPSIGLMQVIGPTFAQYRDPALPNNVRDPLANIVASIRYTLARYGSLPAGYNRAGGYDSGGRLNGRGLFYKQTLSPERVLSDRQNQAFERLVATLDGSTRRANVYSDSSLDAPGVTGGRGNAPLVGTLVAQVPPGATAHEVVDVALFRLRHTRRGLHA